MTYRGSAYTNSFKLIAENGDIAAVLTTAEIERDHRAGLDIRMVFTLAELEHEKRHLPAYLNEKFGPLANPEKHPDINLLNEAIKTVRQAKEATASTLLQNLLLDRATEGQIVQEAHPSQNMLQNFLSGTASKPAPPHPQQG